MMCDSLSTIYSRTQTYPSFSSIPSFPFFNFEYNLAAYFVKQNRGWEKLYYSAVPSTPESKIGKQETDNIEFL